MSVPGPERAGGLRLIRIVLSCVAVGVVLNTTGIVIALMFNSDRVDQINQERLRNIERNCLDVNRRHDQAVQTVDRIMAPRIRAAGPVERKRLEASRETTVLLVEALTPRRDCALLAREQVEQP